MNEQRPGSNTPNEQSRQPASRDTPPPGWSRQPDAPAPSAPHPAMSQADGHP